MSTLTISTADLHLLLSKAMPYADQTSFLPSFNAVRIRAVSGGWITATATDRYQAAIVRTAYADPGADFDALISLADCRAILRAYPKTKATALVSVTVTIDAGQIKLERPDVFPQIALTVKAVDATHTKTIWNIITTAAKRPVQQESLTMFDGRFLRNAPTGDVTVSLADGVKPALMVSDDVIVIVMPKREPDGDPTRHNPASWLDMLEAGAES